MSNSFEVDARWLLTEPGKAEAKANQQLSISSGKVSKISSIDHVDADKKLILPVLSNAHDHARTLRSASLGAFEQPLESWLPYVGLLPGVDPYLCAATSFARSVRGGVGYLMVHYTRVQGTMPYLQEANAVARAARDVGVKIGFAIAMRDRHGIAYCEDDTILAALSPEIRDKVAGRLSVKAVPTAQHLALVDEVAAMITSDATLSEHVTVQYGPSGVQWCSQALLEAVAKASAESGRPVHMHLLETKYQRQWADLHYPQGIVNYLDSLGFLSPRLTLAHCTWARPEELALLAERGVTIAVNTSSNLGIKSGIAPVAKMLKAGCRVAMGLDGLAFDEDDDAVRESRMGYQLHRGWGFDVDMTREQWWAFAASNGRLSVTGGKKVARLNVGDAADLIVMNWAALDSHAVFDDIDPLDILLARGNANYVERVIIGGREVVNDSKLVAVDEAAMIEELLSQWKLALLKESGTVLSWRNTLAQLSKDLEPFYRKGFHPGCC
jgi:5-methylthioadenosine/S-adenosylhomocysteine deaminase